MYTVNNNISDYQSTTTEDLSALKQKTQRALRKDLCYDGPREFRHISRLNSEVETITCEKQQSPNVPKRNTDSVEDIHQYFFGLNSSYVSASIKLPTIGITRQLTKEDVAYPTDFRHVAHLDYREVTKSIENMSDLTKTRSTNSRSTDFEFPINSKGNLTKEDISEPSDFRHIAHVGLDNNEIRMDTEGATMKFSIEKAMIFQQQQDKVTRKTLAEPMQRNSKKNKDSDSENARQKVITKEDIGYPEDFQHLVHVDLQSALKQEMFLEKPSMKNIDDKDKEIQNFISEITDQDTKPAVVTKPIPKPRSVRKRDIEKPQDFRHNAHMSCNKDKPTSIDDSDAVLKNFFKKAGVTEEHLKDEEIRKFIYDFIRQYSTSGDGRNSQLRTVPHTYKNLAENLQDEADVRSREEHLQLLLEMYRRNFPI